ncbi:hypothetical protein HK104_005501 [Borealophlyctis nickersoniae]|nr:hypothetical protein HK104_005501 [Borealophlyctis nickersoniae]
MTSNVSSQSEPLLLGIEHVQLNVPATEETLQDTISKVRHFYASVLGLREIPCSPTIRPPKPHSSHLAILWFAFPGSPHQHLHIVLKPDATPARIDSELEKMAWTSRAHPALRVRDEAGLRELRERLIKEGCEGVKDVVKFEATEGGEAPGRWRFEGRDPWGNTFEFITWI